MGVYRQWAAQLEVVRARPRVALRRPGARHPVRGDRFGGALRSPPGAEPGSAPPPLAAGFHSSHSSCSRQLPRSGRALQPSRQRPPERCQLTASSIAHSCPHQPRPFGRSARTPLPAGSPAGRPTHRPPPPPPQSIHIRNKHRWLASSERAACPLKDIDGHGGRFFPGASSPSGVVAQWQTLEPSRISMCR